VPSALKQPLVRTSPVFTSLLDASGTQVDRRRCRSLLGNDGPHGRLLGQYSGAPARVFVRLVGLTLPLLYITRMALRWRRVSRHRPGTIVQAAPSVTLRTDDVYPFETQ
jgi:hypothetical protein